VVRDGAQVFGAAGRLGDIARVDGSEGEESRKPQPGRHKQDRAL